MAAVEEACAAPDCTLVAGTDCSETTTGCVYTPFQAARPFTNVPEACAATDLGACAGVDISGDDLLLMSLLFGAFVFFSRSTFELRRSEVDQGGAVDLSRNPNRL